MNTESLRKTLKTKWLTYYRNNRDWITRLRVWGTYQETRRPSSSFILGALSAQEPDLMQLLPLVVDLNNNPDRIVAVLGLDFNPEDELDVGKPEKGELEKGELDTKPPNPFAAALKPLTSQTAQPIAQPINLVRQPIAQPITQPIAQPLGQPLGQSFGQPFGNTRMPLDTAQLSIHEQPDRDTGSSTPGDHSRDAEPS